MHCLLILFCTSLGALQISIQGIPLEVEVADTTQLRNKGLSGRRDLPVGTGMLFVYEKPQILHFWMKDTQIPLSIGFFDANKRLIEWKEMPMPGEKNLTLVTSTKPASYALEVSRGWFAENEIELGAELFYRLK